MTAKLLSIAGLVLALAAESAAEAQDKQPAPQRGGCASGFCSISSVPQEDETIDIDAVEADMKRQLAGKPKSPSRAQGGMSMMGGIMNTHPCMRMMATMTQNAVAATIAATSFDDFPARADQPVLGLPGWIRVSEHSGSTTPPSAIPGVAPSTQPISPMMQMMQTMHGRGTPQAYPSMMALPPASPEARMAAQQLAVTRLQDGGALLVEAGSQLLGAIRANNASVTQSALQSVRQALSQLESGLATQQLLDRGVEPQIAALDWFRQQLSLSLAAESPRWHQLFGLSWVHLSSMAALATLSLWGTGLFIIRRRRATALAESVAGAAGAHAPDAITAITSPAGTGPAAPPAPVNPDIAPSKPNSWTGPLLVRRIFQETRQVKTFRLVDPAGGKLPFNYLPGQFLTFTVTPHGQAVKRSYTIASSPTHRDSCEVTVRHEDRGLVSGYLHDRVHEGELLQVTAPSGKFTFAGQDGNSIVLIAGGVGITPMMSVVRYLTDRSWPGDIYLIYGCKADDDVIFREEIEYLKRRFPNLHVTLVAERANAARWPYSTGRITKGLLAEAVPDIASRHIHLCGPKPMMDAAKLMLAELGVQPEQVEIEVFIGKEVSQAPIPAPEQASPTPDAAAPPGVKDAAAALAKVATATFARSNKTAALPPTKTVLEASEDVGVNIEYSCRVGTCGICKVKLLSGTVTMAIEDALEPADKTQNIILACQAKATSDVSVDA